MPSASALSPGAAGGNQPGPCPRARNPGQASVPDWRDRGRSGPYGGFRGLSTEIQGLSALLDACCASRLFELSSRAVIAIEGALVRPDIAKLALTSLRSPSTASFTANELPSSLKWQVRGKEPGRTADMTAPPSPSGPVRGFEGPGPQGARTHSGRRPGIEPCIAYALVSYVRLVQEGRAVKSSAQPTLARTQHLPPSGETGPLAAISRASRPGFLCPRGVSPCSAAGRCVAASTDARRTASVPVARFCNRRLARTATDGPCWRRVPAGRARLRRGYVPRLGRAMLVLGLLGGALIATTLLAALPPTAAGRCRWSRSPIRSRPP